MSEISVQVSFVSCSKCYRWLSYLSKPKDLKECFFTVGVCLLACSMKPKCSTKCNHACREERDWDIVAGKLMLAHSVYGSFLFVVGGWLVVSQCHCHTDDRWLAITAFCKDGLKWNVLIGYIHRGSSSTQQSGCWLFFFFPFKKTQNTQYTE